MLVRWTTIDENLKVKYFKMVVIKACNLNYVNEEDILVVNGFYSFGEGNWIREAMLAIFHLVEEFREGLYFSIITF